MFTGLVQATGIVIEREDGPGAVRLRVEASGFAERLEEGDSVAIDGACLTVAARAEAAFDVQAVPATLAVTTLGSFGPGRAVNLERALRAGDPLGGHLVQGHVDGTAEVTGVRRAEEATELRIRLPAEVARLTAPRGSIAVDGVSLTVQALEGDIARLAIVPYTWRRTALGRLRPGDAVNVEADLIARYIDRLLVPWHDAVPVPGGAPGRATSQPERES